MGRPLPAVLTGLLVLGAMSAAVVGLWSLTRYVEFGEPADRPYVVVRVYGGTTFHVNDTVEAALVLVNPWEQEAVVWHHGATYFDILGENGTWHARAGSSLYFLGSGRVITIDPGSEHVLFRILWRPTNLDYVRSVWDEDLWEVPPEAHLFGSRFCNFRTPDTAFVLRGYLGRGVAFAERPPNLLNYSYYQFSGAGTDIEPVVIDAPVRFVGTPGPCLAQDPPVLELRTSAEAFGLDEPVRIDVVLRNPREDAVTLSFDYWAVLTLGIRGPDGEALFPPPGEPIFWDRPNRGPALTLGPGEERTLFRFWWNASSLALEREEVPLGWDFLWERPGFHSLDPRGEGTYEVVATLNWMSLWAGPAYDWGTTPVPARVAPQTVSRPVAFA